MSNKSPATAGLQSEGNPVNRFPFDSLNIFRLRLRCDGRVTATLRMICQSYFTYVLDIDYAITIVSAFISYIKLYTIHFVYGQALTN